MGTNTDPYQQAEGRYRLTRGILQTLGDARNPFSVLTKSTMILRDLDVFQAAAERTEVRANLSIGTLDEDVWHMSEPGTPPPLRRVEAVARLNEAGSPVRRADRADPARASPTATSSSPTSCAPASRPAPSRSRASRCTCAPACASSSCPGWSATGPTSSSATATLYGARNGYLAREEQERVSERVRALVQRFGGCAKSPRESRLAPVPEPRRQAPAPPHEQLPLVG